MAQTQVADVIVPQVFLPYMIQRSAELTAFYESGILDMDPTFAGMAANGGSTDHMPFWNDITDPSEVLSDSTSLTPAKIVADQDICQIHNRGKAWSTNDLAKYLAGDDPMQAIGDLVAAYWARENEHMLISTLTGVFASATGPSSGPANGQNMATNSVLSISTQGTVTSANTLNGSTFIDAKQLLGDNKTKLKAIAMHSKTEAALLKLDLIDFLPDSTGKVNLPTFQGLRVIIDDNCPVSADGKPVYTSYLFGEGAIAMGVSSKNDPVEGGFGTWQVEFSRVALAGQNVMINRRRFILHPRGVKWLGGTQSGISPTNAELAIGTNWQQVYQTKNIRLIAITHNNL